MKTKLLTFVLVLLSFLTMGKTNDANVLSGKSMTSLGDYLIKQADTPLSIEGTTFKTFQLIYENADRPILIGVETKKKCTNFIVKGPNFELEYFCNRGTFGVKRIDEAYQEINKNKNLVVINPDELQSQEIISVSEKTETQLLGLIACYLPLLIREQYRNQI